MPSARELANAIRALSMDAIQAANSGHPGAPMGMADIAEVLWRRHLRHNPADPGWHNRDRFVLSNGHGSMLLYSLLNLTGYDLPVQELRNFRQLGSRTPGHPEYGDTPGVETTTGPLGQGFANAVGMALAEKVLAARYNRPGMPLVDHFTYVFLGDGCLMEGISHEAAGLAGVLGLGKLICFYDDNGISIDGDVSGWFDENTPERFRAYGWQVIDKVDGHDAEAVNRAIEVAHAGHDAPTLICCKTVIGWGSPNKAGSESAHGSPLGADEVALVRERIGWPFPPFEVPGEIRNAWDARDAGATRQLEWDSLFTEYAAEHPDAAVEYQRRMSGALPEGWDDLVTDAVATAAAKGAVMATRKASQAALEALGPALPELIGGSADLTGSNNTRWSGSSVISADEGNGNYVYFGVREFGMTAVLNGLALHGGFVPYGGTFLTFSDYARNAVRMAGLMKAPAILVYSHDSIGLGEDGPTHQSVEHMASLRIIPNVTLWRPCDSVETVVAWADAIERRDGPTCLVLTRQSVPHQGRTDAQIADIRRGGYVLLDCDGAPEAIIIGTGSEVGLAMDAARKLNKAGRRVRVVSMPCTRIFDAQPDEYRQSVLPASVRSRVAVEAGVTEGWWRYVGMSGRIIGIDRYGESAPAAAVYEYSGITVDAVVRAVEEII